MAEVPDRNILPEVQLKVAAARRCNKRAFDRGRPNQVAVYNALHMLQHRISVIAGLGERRIFVGSQRNGVGPFTPTSRN